jgi:peptidoglycan/LPS O-acetylase OafA/YrhL
MTARRVVDWLDSRFRRVTSSVDYIPQLDGLRALAVLLVIGHHVFAIYLTATHRLGVQLLPRDWDLIRGRSPLVPWGIQLAFGVQLFFAISGFVLALPFVRAMFDGAPMPSTRLYLLRRLVRIEPPYLLSMSLFFFFVVHPWGQPHWHVMVMYHIFGPHYLASIVYLHALIYAVPSWLGGIAWTLEIEIQFYLFMPVLAQMFRLRRPALRRCIFAVMTICAGSYAQFIVPHLHDLRWQYTLLGNLQYFLAGVLLADIYLDPPPSLRFGPRAGDLCAVLGAAYTVCAFHWMPAFNCLLPFAVMVFYFGVFHHGLAGKLFRSPWLTIPGTMCYSIYLYHFFIIDKWMSGFLMRLPAQHDLWFDCLLQMILVLPVILLIAAVLYLLVERPFIVLSHVVTRRWRPAVRTSAQEVAA